VLSVVCRLEYNVKSESQLGDGALRDRELYKRSRPTTTVVVAWIGIISELEHALRGLIPRCHEAGAELIVVATSSVAERRRLGVLYPHVRVIDAPAQLCHKQLREIGASAANGDIVVLLNDERLSTSSLERQLPVTGATEWEYEAQHSSLTRWLESMAVSAQTPAASEPSVPEPRTLLASWRNVAALLIELSRFRLLRTSRATRS
jgi:hypothetical protein